MDKKYYCLEFPHDDNVTAKKCVYQSECKDCEFYMTPKENLRKKFIEGVEEYLEDLKSYEDKQV